VINENADTKEARYCECFSNLVASPWVKLQVKEFDTDSTTVVLFSVDVVQVEITNVTVEGSEFSQFQMAWKVRHVDGETRGHVILTLPELLAAFSLSQESGDHGDWLIEQFGADSAEQGKFIRWGPCLNIPDPGTGSDGDSNVFIYIDSAIKSAVSKLIA
jgi:hypothetical protein